MLNFNTNNQKKNEDSKEKTIEVHDDADNKMKVSFKNKEKITKKTKRKMKTKRNKKNCQER